jgi:hypothetical protein
MGRAPPEAKSRAKLRYNQMEHLDLVSIMVYKL